MTTEEIINTIKTHKKYSNSRFQFEENCVWYTIGNKKYKIDIETGYSKMSFYHSGYNLNLRDIKVTIIKDKCNHIKALAKFREVIRNIDRLDVFLNNRQKHTDKIRPVILNYIKEQWFITPDLDDTKNNSYRVNFINTDYTKRRRRNDSCDISTENVIYNIFVAIKDGKFYYSLQFRYNEETKKLTLHKKEEVFRDFSKDMTKIIRSEKLKKLMFNEETTE